MSQWLPCQYAREGADSVPVDADAQIKSVSSTRQYDATACAHTVEIDAGVSPHRSHTVLVLAEMDERHVVSEEHERSVVAVAGVLWYEDALQTVAARHWRSLVAVGDTVSYSVLEHTRVARHTRSDADVGAVD
jgi:hypothetical protein